MADGLPLPRSTDPVAAVDNRREALTVNVLDHGRDGHCMLLFLAAFVLAVVAAPAVFGPCPLGFYLHSMHHFCDNEQRYYHIRRDRGHSNCFGARERSGILGAGRAEIARHSHSPGFSHRTHNPLNWRKRMRALGGHNMVSEVPRSRVAGCTPY